MLGVGLVLVLLNAMAVSPVWLILGTVLVLAGLLGVLLPGS